MAVQTPTEVTPNGIINRHTIVTQWGATATAGVGNIANTDTATAVMDVAGATMKSIQIEGTFNGVTVIIEGSNDGTNFETLNDLGGSALSKTAAGLFSIREMPLWIRWRLTGGGASTALLITLMSSRQF